MSNAGGCGDWGFQGSGDVEQSARCGFRSKSCDEQSVAKVAYVLLKASGGCGGLADGAFGVARLCVQVEVVSACDEVVGGHDAGDGVDVGALVREVGVYGQVVDVGDGGSWKGAGPCWLPAGGVANVSSATTKPRSHKW